MCNNTISLIVDIAEFYIKTGKILKTINQALHFIDEDEIFPRSLRESLAESQSWETHGRPLALFTLPLVWKDRVSTWAYSTTALGHTLERHKKNVGALPWETLCGSIVEAACLVLPLPLPHLAVWSCLSSSLHSSFLVLKIKPVSSVYFTRVLWRIKPDKIAQRV